MKIQGGCHCGLVRYEAEVDPENVTVCHCTDCQIISGAPFRTIVPCPEGSFTLLSGELKTYEKTGDSGNRRALDFCPECGTQIYGTSAGEGPRIIGIRVGTVDQREELPPKRELWCQSTLGWLPDLGTGNRFERQPG